MGRISVPALGYRRTYELLTLHLRIFYMVRHSNERRVVMFSLRKRVGHLLQIVSLPISLIAVAKAEHREPSKPTVEQLQREIDDLRADIRVLNPHAVSFATGWAPSRYVTWRLEYNHRPTNLRTSAIEVAKCLLAETRVIGVCCTRMATDIGEVSKERLQRCS